MAVPIAMTQEQQALQASLRGPATRAGPLAVARTDPAALRYREITFFPVGLSR
jgi:hypothetical protein